MNRLDKLSIIAQGIKKILNDPKNISINELNKINSRFRCIPKKNKEEFYETYDIPLDISQIIFNLFRSKTKPKSKN